jgi:transposase-like protein
MGRRKFTREFKLEAVKLVKERGVSAAQAARDLGISQNVMSRWVREASGDKAQAFPGRGQMKPDDAEVARLKRELAKRKAERGILKRPSASSPRDRNEICLHCQGPQRLVDAPAVRSSGRVSGAILRMATPAGESSSAG